MLEPLDTILRLKVEFYSLNYLKNKNVFLISIKFYYMLTFCMYFYYFLWLLIYLKNKLDKIE
jgi:hypothetical protein